MIRQSPGKMFLADERGITENEKLRIISTFNFEGYQRPHKQPFGALLALNDCTLGAKQIRHSNMNDLLDVIIIPIVGGIEVTINDVEPMYVEAGTVQVFTMRCGEGYHLHNPFDRDLVRYLELHVAVTKKLEPFYAHFDLDDNLLTKLMTGTDDDRQYRIEMIKMQGRQENTFTLSNLNNGMFFYVLQGACEIEYRLLHSGDALALWDIQEAEFEALSKEVIILILEVLTKKK